MSEIVKPIAHWSAALAELMGIILILGFAIYALFDIVRSLLRGNQGPIRPLFQEVRQRLGHGILLGLEFLVAADIIYTVAVELSFESVGILAAILLIRTFLSFTLGMELTGRWPWGQSGAATPPHTDPE